MADPRRDAIIAAAAIRRGLPYRIDPPPDGVNNIDCSLYVLMTLRDAGLPLTGVRTAEQIRQACVPIGWDDVQAGDLLFFEHTYEPDPRYDPPGPDGRTASHIGISLGAGSHQMWNAEEKHGVSLDRIDSDYWQSHIFEARRHPAMTAATAVAKTPSDQPYIEGIDLASYQGKPDWDAIKAAGIQFAIIKATEGLEYINPTFAYNWDGAQRVGIVRAGYHWGKPGQGAGQQARFFTDTVGPLAPTDFLMLDSEEGDGDVATWTVSCLKAISGIVGFKPVDYTGRWFSDPHGFPDHPELAEYPLALAAYQETLPAAPAPWSKVTIWQYSDAGQIPGIVGNVDRDRFIGTMAQLRALGKGGASVVQADTLDKWRGTVGSGILELMAADNTEPIMASTWLPLGRGQADAEAEMAVAVSGRQYFWHLSTGRTFKYDPAA